jgi:hypothetical protein
MSDFVIVGDTERNKGCLICTCGTKANAEKVLKRITENPTEMDIKQTKGHTNLRIEEVADEDCWWKRW